MIDRLGSAVGSGSYGQIYSATTVNRGPNVAVKSLIVIGTSDFGYSYKEADICLKFNRHPNVCGATSIYYMNSFEWPESPPKRMRFDSIALVMPLARGDLYNLCKIEVLSEVRIKMITTQILLALEFIHKSGYVHRDIKPTNILYFEGDNVKVCDFGLSKKYFPYDDHSPIVASDYFRPPEALTLTPIYDYSVDIWALGCTVHYMFCSNFPCAEWDFEKDGKYTSIAQVQAIIDCMPYEISPDTLSFDPIGRHLRYETKMTTEEFFATYRDDVADLNLVNDFLIGGMLMFDYRHRKKSEELLKHPYLSSVSMRTRVRPLGDSIEAAAIRLRSQRECCTTLMYETYMKCSRLEWYKDKVLFTAISAFDRALSAIVDDHSEMELTDRNVQTYFRTCLYISAKYYCASVDCDLRYDSFPFPDLKLATKERAAEFEHYIVKHALKGCIYQISIYDVLTNYRKPRDVDVCSLLDFVIRGAHNGLSPYQAFERWEDQQLVS